MDRAQVLGSAPIPPDRLFRRLRALRRWPPGLPAPGRRVALTAPGIVEGDGILIVVFDDDVDVRIEVDARPSDSTAAAVGLGTDRETQEGNVPPALKEGDFRVPAIADLCTGFCRGDRPERDDVTRHGLGYACPGTNPRR